MARIRTALAVSILGVALATDPLAAQEALAAANTGDWTSGAYKYDGAGNIVQIGTSQSPNTEGRPNHYIYDLRGRLVEGTANTAAQNNTQVYTYDVYGNLTRVVTNGTNTVSMGIDATSNHIDKPTACVAGSTCVTGTFDSAGNQTSSSAGYAYKYDALNTMSELSGPQGRHDAYLYDDNGERVATVADAGATQTWRYTLRGADGNIWREYDDTVTGGQHSWRWVQDYIYREGKLLATYKANGVGELAQHFHLDHLGTPRIITDDGGRRIATRTYMPYGEEAPGSSFDGEVMKFTGHERDIAPDGSVNSLDYMHARYYGAIQARFLALDPVIKSGAMANPDLWNRYTYTANSPLNRVDPDGRNWFFIDQMWQWHMGKTYLQDGRTYTSSYTHLLVAEAIGTASTGATRFRLTLYDQNKAVESGTYFSGGGGHNRIPAGNYTIRGDIKDPRGPNEINPSSPLKNPPVFYGMQVIRKEALLDSSTGDHYDVYGAYGPMRAYLNPWNLKIPGSTGNYLHGQAATGQAAHGYTHGCLCYGQDTTIIQTLWKLGEKVPVSIDGSVRRP